MKIVRTKIRAFESKRAEMLTNETKLLLLSGRRCRYFMQIRYSVLVCVYVVFVLTNLSIISLLKQ